MIILFKFFCVFFPSPNSFIIYLKSLNSDREFNYFKFDYFDSSNRPSTNLDSSSPIKIIIHGQSNLWTLEMKDAILRAVLIYLYFFLFL